MKITIDRYGDPSVLLTPHLPTPILLTEEEERIGWSQDFDHLDEWLPPPSAEDMARAAALGANPSDREIELAGFTLVRCRP